MYKLEIKKGGTYSNLRSPPLHVGGDGFEPPKRDAADLQSAPFGHSGNHPFLSSAKVHFLIETTKNIQKILIRNVEKNRSLYY